jgi:hypothetical protein
VFAYEWLLGRVNAEKLLGLTKKRIWQVDADTFSKVMQYGQKGTNPMYCL